MISCHKDKIINETTIDRDPPVSIGPVEIEGKVQNIDGVKLSNVLINAFQDGQLRGFVRSDNNGYYTTKFISLDPLIPITLEYVYDKLSIKYRRLLVKPNEKTTVNSVLGNIPQDSVTLDEGGLSSPSDTNLIKIWGFTKLADGTPVRGVQCNAVWDFFRTPNGRLLGRKSIQDYSGEDGYFELLVPKNKTIYFNTFYLKYPNAIFGQCNINFQYIQPNELADWQYNNIGNFTSDTRIILRDDIELDLITANIKGKAIRCDGTPAFKGSLYVTLGQILGPSPNHLILGPSITDSNYFFGPNGEFEIYIEACKTAGLEYGVFIRIYEDDFEGQLKTTDLNQIGNLPPISLCTDWSDKPDDFSMSLGSDPVKIYQKGGDNATSGINDLFTSFSNTIGDEEETVYFAVKNISVGINSVERLEMWKSRRVPHLPNVWEVYEKPFIAKPEDLLLTIEKIEIPYVFGTIEGSVNTISGVKHISINFKIYNK